MQLQIFTTGQVVTTLGADGAHHPEIWQFRGKPIRVIFRPNLPADRAMAFVLTDAAKALGSKDPRHAARSMNLIEGEDQGVELISTPGGPQKMKVLTFKGLAKFLMRSTHEGALEFQDWLASKSSDLTFHGFALRDKSVKDSELKDPGMVEVSRESLKWMCDRVVELEKARSQTIGISKADLMDFGKFILSEIRGSSIRGSAKSVKKRQEGLYPPLTAAGRAEMKRLDFWMVAAHLTEKSGQSRLHQNSASGLTIRCVNYALQHRKNEVLFWKFTYGGQTVTFIWRPIIELVERTNWRSGAPDPMKNGDLFSQDNLPEQASNVMPFQRKAR